MDTVTALITIRDSLRTNLTDPYVTAGGNSRTWIHTDMPLAEAKYPRIEVRKVDNPTKPISIGPAYMEHEQIFINIWFYAKSDFKITVNDIEYKNEQLIEYYEGLIKSTLKLQFNALHTAGLGGYKHINTTIPSFNEATQLYAGAVTIRVWWFQV